MMMPDTPLSFSQQGIDLLCSFEGFRGCPYLDSVGVSTIGYGSTYYENGSRVTISDQCISQDRGRELMLFIWNRDFLPIVLSSVTVSLNQQQLDALGCLIYNIGKGAFKSSTVVRRINSSADRPSIEAAWSMWNKGGGHVIQGLVNRRAAEISHYFSTSA